MEAGLANLAVDFSSILSSFSWVTDDGMKLVPEDS